jgi:hypothetical protein
MAPPPVISTSTTGPEPAVTLRGHCPLVFLFSGYLIAKQLAILKILNSSKYSTARLQMPSSPQVVK